jgi:hypothetical protein
VNATKHLNNALYAAFIEKVSSPAYDGPSVYRNILEELQIAGRMRRVLDHPDVDLVANAEAQVRNLYFSNALLTYKELNRVRSDSHFYIERAVIHIALDDWNSALAVAKKSGNLELISVLAFAFGDCAPCFANLEFLLGAVQRQSTTIVGVYELLWILTLSVLAKLDLGHTADYAISFLTGLLEIEGIPAAVLILKAFADADFSRVTWDPENVG